MKRNTVKEILNIFWVLNNQSEKWQQYNVRQQTVVNKSRLQSHLPPDQPFDTWCGRIFHLSLTVRRYGPQLVLITGTNLEYGTADCRRRIRFSIKPFLDWAKLISIQAAFIKPRQRETLLILFSSNKGNSPQNVEVQSGFKRSLTILLFVAFQRRRWPQLIKLNI